MPQVLNAESVAHARWRLLRSYMTARRLPGYWLMMVILLGMVAWGSGWGENHAPTTLRLLVFLLPVATSSVIGVSLWSPFGETERAAGTWLPFGRYLHLMTMIALALLTNQVAVETWVPAAETGHWDVYLLRHTLALIGITLVASALLDSRLSWIGPALVAMPGLVAGYIRVEQSQGDQQTASFFYDGARHLMLRPEDSVLAAVVAVGLFIAGMVTVVWRGERLAEPDDTAG